MLGGRDQNAVNRDRQNKTSGVTGRRALERKKGDVVSKPVHEHKTRISTPEGLSLEPEDAGARANIYAPHS